MEYDTNDGRIGPSAFAGGDLGILWVSWTSRGSADGAAKDATAITPRLSS